MSLSGGGDSGNYFVSAGYYNNDGVSYGNTFDRYSFRVNTQGKKGWFSFGENLAYSLTNTDPNQTNTYNDFLRMMPTIPIYDENNPGGYGYGDAAKYNTFGVNPIAREDLEYRHFRQNRLNGSLWLEFKPFDFLSYKSGVLTFTSTRTHGSVAKVIGLRTRSTATRKGRRLVTIPTTC